MADEASRHTDPELPVEDRIDDSDDEILANITELNHCSEELAQQMNELFERKDVWIEKMVKFSAAVALFGSYQDVVKNKLKECLKELDSNFDLDASFGLSKADRHEILAKSSIDTNDINDEARARISEFNRCCKELEPKMDEFSASTNIWKEEIEKFKAAIEMYNRNHDVVKNKLTEFKSRFGESSDISELDCCVEELDKKMDQMEKCRDAFKSLHSAVVQHRDSISKNPALKILENVEPETSKSTSVVAATGSEFEALPLMNETKNESDTKSCINTNIEGLKEKKPEFDIGEDMSSLEYKKIESNPSKDGTEMWSRISTDVEIEEEGVISSEEMEEEATDPMNNSLEIYTNIDGLAEEMNELKRKIEEEDDQKLKATNLNNLKSPRRGF